jgi:hypothetical protein
MRRRKVSLKDLQECRKNTVKLLHQRNGLQHGLYKCQEYLAKTRAPKRKCKAINEQRDCDDSEELMRRWRIFSRRMTRCNLPRIGNAGLSEVI